MSENVLHDRPMWSQARCTGCEVCVSTCPNWAIRVGTDGREIIEARCTSCGACVEACPSDALELLLGLVGRAHLVHYDLMAIDPVRHEQYTGQSNRLILGNLLTLAEAMRGSEEGMRLWIRTPLVSGSTATDGNLRSIGSFIAEHLSDVVECWELCAVDDSGADHYRRLGQVWPYAEIPHMAPRELMRLCGVARSSGVDPGIVRVTGTDCSQREAMHLPEDALLTG